MAYRIRFSYNVDYIGLGQGPSGSPTGGQGGGNAQTFGGINTPGFAGENVAGGGAGNIINAADITTLTNAVAADISAQLNVASVLAKLQGFATGGT